MKAWQGLDLDQFRLPERVKRFETVLRQRTQALTLVLDRVHGSHNISAVIRSADAFGIQEMHVVGTFAEEKVSLFEENQGISLGADRWVDVRKHPSVESVLQELQEKNFTVVVVQPEYVAECKATELSMSEISPSKVSLASVCVSQLPFHKRLALVFGNERDGICTEFRRAASLSAHIQMFGFVESLNVSVAVAICLFCSTIASSPSQRQVPGLSPEEFCEIKKKWLQQDLVRSRMRGRSPL